MTKAQRLRLIREFNAFDQENPHVWLLFERFALESAYSGRKHFSIRSVCERVRWETTVRVHDEDGFKISNNHLAFYARRFMRKHPRFDGFVIGGHFYDGYFRTKPSAADSEEDRRRHQLPKGNDKDLPW